MTFASTLKRALLPGIALLAVASASQAQNITFYFCYDDTFDAGPGGDVLGNIIGNGTMTLVDPGNGDFTLSAIGPFTYSSTIGASSWTELDLGTNLAVGGVRISGAGLARRLQFIGDGSMSVSGGSVDFQNGSGDILTHEPDFVTGFYNLYFSDFVGGNYTAFADPSRASAVPEPSEWAAMGLGVLGVGGLMVRARRKRA